MFKPIHILIYCTVIVYTIYNTVVWGDFITPTLLILITSYLLNKKNSIKQSHKENQFLKYEQNYLVRTKSLR